MSLLTRSSVLALGFTVVTLLNGCTVLGVVADNAIFDNEERHRPLMEQDRVENKDTLFGQLGLEADIAIVKKAVEVITGEPEQPKTRCKMSNGIRFCYEEGAEGY